MRGHEATKTYSAEGRNNSIESVESMIIGETRALVVEHIGFDNLTVEGRGLSSVWNPEIYAAVESAQATHEAVIQKIKAAKDQASNNGSDWQEELRYKAFNTGVQSAIADKFLRQRVAPADADALGALPIRDKNLPGFTDDWLAFVLKRHSEHATVGELERLATVFSTIGNRAPVLPNHPYYGATRTIATSKGNIPVDAYKLRKLQRTFQVRNAGLPLGDDFLDQIDPQAFRIIAELGWNDCDFLPNGAAPQKSPSARHFREFLRDSRFSQEQAQRVLMTAGVAGLATTVVVSPAAAQGTEAVQTNANSPSSISVGYSGKTAPVIVIQQRLANSSSTLAVPIAASEALPNVSLLDQSPQGASTGLSVPLTETVQFISDEATLPVVPQQKLEAEPDTLERLKKGGLTPQERVAAEIQTYGSNAPTIENPAKDKTTAPSTFNQLSRENPLLARYLNNQLSSAEQRLGTQDLTDLALLEETQYSIVLLRSALVSPESLKGLSEDQKKEILSAHNAEYTEALHLKAKEILKTIQSPKLGAGEGYDEKDQDLLSHIIAKLELTVGPEAKTELDALVQKVRAQYENETPNETGHNEAPDVAIDGKELSGRQIEIKALELMMKSDDKYIARGALIAKKLMQRKEELDGSITRIIAFGFVANMRDEIGKDNLDFGIEQDGGPAVGSIQWEGARKERLFEFAKDREKPWQDEDVQIDFLIHELETSESGAWDKILEADTAEEAATIILQYFERAADSKPGGENDDDRRGYARKLVKAYKAAKEKIEEQSKPKTPERPKQDNKIEAVKGMGEKAKAELTTFLNSVTRKGSQLTSDYTNMGIREMKSRGLKNGYIPDSEMSVVTKQGHKLQKAAAESYLAMDADFNKDHPGMHLDFGSDITAYRDYDEQVRTKAKKGRWAATPGESSHGMARAGDFNDMRAGSIRDKWMKKNAWKYGWFKPKELGPKSNKYEPWHYNFVLIHWSD